MLPPLEMNAWRWAGSSGTVGSELSAEEEVEVLTHRRNVWKESGSERSAMEVDYHSVAPDVACHSMMAMQSPFAHGGHGMQCKKADSATPGLSASPISTPSESVYSAATSPLHERHLHLLLQDSLGGSYSNLRRLESAESHLMRLSYTTAQDAVYCRAATPPAPTQFPRGCNCCDPLCTPTGPVPRSSFGALSEADCNPFVQNSPNAFEQAKVSEQHVPFVNGYKLMPWGELVAKEAAPGPDTKNSGGLSSVKSAASPVILAKPVSKVGKTSNPAVPKRVRGRGGVRIAKRAAAAAAALERLNTSKATDGLTDPVDVDEKYCPETAAVNALVPCAVCRAILTAARKKKDGKLLRTLKSIKISCEYVQKCRWKGTLRDYALHFEECSAKYSQQMEESSAAQDVLLPFPGTVIHSTAVASSTPGYATRLMTESDFLLSSLATGSSGFHFSPQADDTVILKPQPLEMERVQYAHPSSTAEMPSNEISHMLKPREYEDPSGFVNWRGNVNMKPCKSVCFAAYQPRAHYSGAPTEITQSSYNALLIELTERWTALSQTEISAEPHDIFEIFVEESLSHTAGDWVCGMAVRRHDKSLNDNGAVGWIPRYIYTSARKVVQSKR